ncbi:hypothetical protein F5051DRAFT_409881 [Lentinula edodes]|uniref:uncharacterized protein n=1 Tax=Lentinula edodes TaxID=5353 RepID=UPI001E8E0A7A|nr:uncharacterized protein C8R40DRAFT_1087753 [Lentinula edodes]KAH7878895.1 hypothetical protein C8R40DRAFT_1087753 [Lentinula edodes]KAJ3877013.1 hypothetical protein F5051DRAFT_409881 [Lentinula edodes]
MLRLCTRNLRRNGFLYRPLTRNFSYSKHLLSTKNFSQLHASPGKQTTETFANSVRPSIRNQVLFFLFGSSSILLYSAWATNIETAIVLEKLKSQSSVWQAQSIANVDLRRFQQMELVKGLRSTYKYLNTQAAEIPQLIRPYLNAAYVALLQPYADASEGRRLCWKICLLNTGIWLMWQFQRLQPMMNRAFVHQPLSGLTYTLLSSTFSHSSLLHLAFNCLALEGFGSAATTYLRQAQDKNVPGQLESTSSYHFLSFYVSAGIFASLVSHVANARIRYPKLIAQLSSPASRTPATDTWASAVAAASSTVGKSATTASVASASAVTIPGSLGASGAVYSCVTLVALAYPDSQVSLIFPPVTPIGIQTAALGILTLDMIGIYRGWRMLDHWAHLGGAAFGALYFYYGPSVWSHTRAIL